MGSIVAKNFSKIHSNYAVNLAPAKNEAVIDIFGVVGIWWDGVESKQFVEDIKALDVDEITINISSPGGYVDDGLMIYDAIRSHRAKVTARLSGLVASAATWIACAADEVIGSETLLYMIHEVQGGAFGTKEDMRKAAEVSEKMEDIIVNLYRKKTGQRKSQLLKWMEAETWFTIDEAIEAGFVDSKGEGFSFEYESSARDTETRNFLTNALNCANIPSLPTDTATNLDNDIMSEISNEDKGLLKGLLNFLKKGSEVEVEEATETQTNEAEALQNKVDALTKELEAANAANFEKLTNTIVDALKPQIVEQAERAANVAVETFKDELTNVVTEVSNKVAEVEKKQNEVEEATEKATNQVTELAEAVNEQKGLSAQPETKKNNGEGLVEVVAPVNTFEAFVKSNKKR